MNTLRKFDKYLHELGIDHSHTFIADGELIIRKNSPEKESAPIQKLEKGYKKFAGTTDPVERCVVEDDV
jgi:uncharacterized protein (DUF1697 family)